MRRVVEDEVPQRTATVAKRGPIGQTSHPLLAPRKVEQIVELTSRESTSKVKDAKHRLRQTFVEDRHVDVVLASNMISVGVDIDRLGLMVVAGQPHDIGRVHPGHQSRRPSGRSSGSRGELLQHAPAARPFVLRAVRELSPELLRLGRGDSVTPFSEPALDRALAAVLFAMIRHGDPALAPAGGAMEVPNHPDAIKRAIDALKARAARQADADGDGLANVVKQRAKDLADAWCSQIGKAREENLRRGYSKFDADKKGFARPMLVPPMEQAQPRSTRSSRRRRRCATRKGLSICGFDSGSEGSRYEATLGEGGEEPPIGAVRRS